MIEILLFTALSAITLNQTTSFILSIMEVGDIEIENSNELEK